MLTGNVLQVTGANLKLKRRDTDKINGHKSGNM